MEAANLCETCRKLPQCFLRGISEQETCNDYTPLSLDELAQRDEFVEAVTVGRCPQCESASTYDCDSPLELIIKDSTVGYCLDCETYWCLECGYIFGAVRKWMECPHWQICAECSEENAYLDMDKFIEKVCPTCEHYAAGCQLEDPSQCEKQDEFMCPYCSDVSECPRIQAVFKEQS